jgi:hypothetical protein
MYDHFYGNINYGHTSGLTPYYKMLNLLFRYTLCPIGGDFDNISHRARNLHYQMAPGQPKFNAIHFLWNDIIICSHTSSIGCHYAPYIFLMVKHATKLDLKTDVVHEPHETSKRKIAQSFRLDKHTTDVDARGLYPGIYPIDRPIDAGASSSQAPPTKIPYDPLPMEGASYSHGAPRGKIGKFNFLAKDLFACFNMLHKDAREREADRRWLAQELHRQEKNQKDMAARSRLNLPHSLVHEMRTFDPPSPVPNPWEDLGSWVPVDAEEEEDYGGEKEEYDEDDEE